MVSLLEVSMSIITDEKPFAARLLEALGVNLKMVTGIYIKVPAEDITIVTIDFYMDPGQEDQLIKVMQDYYLMKIPDGKNET